MTFFNQKENILEFKLTGYGESLFSQGKFKPEYYSFSDDSVNYNFSSSGEGQNSIDGRIKLETPYLRVQKNRFSTSRGNKINNIAGIDFETEIAKRESLGKCDTTSSGSSRLKVFILDNEIETFNNFYTSSNSTRVDIPIPQINVNLEFQTAIDDYENPKIVFEPDEALSQEILFSDGGSMYVSSEQVTLLIQEEGVTAGFGDFEVEVYEIMDEVENYLGDKPLRKLTFQKQIQDLYVDSENIYLTEAQRNESLSLVSKYPNTTDDVEYYFNVFTDAYEEIPKNFICSLVAELRRKDFALDASIEEMCPREQINVVKDNAYTNGLPSSDRC